MITVLNKAWAFVWKDFLTAASYKFAFVTQFLGLFLSALTLYFLSRVVAPADLPTLRPYGGDYFAFVIIGVALGSYLHVALQSFAGCVREGQTLGTLEMLLVTQTSVPQIIVFSSIYTFAATSVRVVLYLLFGALVLGLRLGGANYAGALLMLLLTVLAFSSVGVLSASFVMVFKRGDPFNWVFSALSWLVGGVFYPVAVLPGWLQTAARALPITHALEGMRMALLRGYSLAELLPSILPLLLFTAVVMPISLLVFAFAVRRAKMHGSLAQY